MGQVSYHMLMATLSAMMVAMVGMMRVIMGRHSERPVGRHVACCLDYNLDCFDGHQLLLIAIASSPDAQRQGRRTADELPRHRASTRWPPAAAAPPLDRAARGERMADQL